MATPPSAPKLAKAVRERVFRNTRIVILLGLSLLMVSCLVFSWTTRDAMSGLPSRPTWQVRPRQSQEDYRRFASMANAQALAPLADTAEEKEFARDAKGSPTTI